MGIANDRRVVVGEYHPGESVELAGGRALHRRGQTVCGWAYTISIRPVKHGVMVRKEVFDSMRLRMEKFGSGERFPGVSALLRGQFVQRVLGQLQFGDGPALAFD